MVGTLDRHTANMWTARIMPIVITGVVGYASYVYIGRMCIHYLLRPPLVPVSNEPNTYYQQNPQTGKAVGFLVGYCTLLLLMVVTYCRLVYTVLFNPGYTPRGHTALGRSGEGKEAWVPPVSSDGPQNGQEMEPVKPPKAHRSTKSSSSPNTQYGLANTAPENLTNNPNYGPTNPSLKPRQELTQVFLRDMYTCDVNGEPRWCGRCGNWKPDRTHHCSEVGRCVEGFDHFCPWVGGVVGLTSFKFFVQFIFYASTYCLYVIVTMAYVFHNKTKTLGWQSGDANWIGTFALGGFFGAFVSGMCLSNTQMMYWGVTTNENFNKYIKRYHIAVLDHDQSPSSTDVNNSIDSSKTGTINTSAPPTTTSPPPPSDIPPWQRNEPDRNTESGFQRRLLVPLSVSAQPSTINNTAPLSSSTTTASSPTSSNSTTSFKKLSTKPTGHYYKIYLTKAGMNPWHQGLYRAATDILGPRPWDWFLPIHRPNRTAHAEDDGHAHATGLGRWSDEKLQRMLDEEGWSESTRGAARSRVHGMRSWYEFGEEVMEFVRGEDEKSRQVVDNDNDENGGERRSKRKRRKSRSMVNE